MNSKYDITDSELEIMQVLWNKGSSTLSDIVSELDKTKIRNKNTVKTLIYRLVDKQAVKSQKSGGQGFLYSPLITEKGYLLKANNSFLKKLYQGSAEKLLLNFVESKTVTKEELQNLIDYLNKEE